MAVEYAITTVDNPYDPFDDFSSWFTYDVLHQHNTCDHLARVSYITDSLSESEYNSEIQRAIDSMIENDAENKYRRVSRASVSA